MLGRPFHGYEAGTERARALGLHALWGGRPDLLQPEEPVNAHVGIGQVPFTAGSSTLVGDASVRVLSATPGRARVKLRNTSFQNADGTISGYWREGPTGVWYPTPSNPNPNEQCRLAYAFGRPATASDPILECGQAVEIAAMVPDADLWVLAIGSAGSTVRYVLEELVDHDAAREQQQAKQSVLRGRDAHRIARQDARTALADRQRNARRLTAGQGGGGGYSATRSGGWGG